MLIGVTLSAAASADTLVRNIKGYSPTPTGVAAFEFLVFNDAGRIVSVGSGEEPAANVVIDGKGRVLLPGLSDAHGHVSSLGLARLSVDLVGTRSLEEAVARVADYAAANPDLPWIVGRGWNQELWQVRAFPSAADLDRVVARPVWLNRVDGHAGWANTTALRRAGISAETPDMAGGKILRDAGGEATGVLVDRAMELIEAVVPPPDIAALDKALNLAFAELLANGITSVHDAGVSVAEARLYQARAAAGRMPVRIYAMLAGIDAVRGFGFPFATPDERLVVRSMKLVADGALGSRGAALLEPYADSPDNRGLVIEDLPALAAKIAEARALGYQVNVHAIGDRANRIVLDAFGAAETRPAERHRIEHAQIVALDDIPRFAAQGIVPSMQAIHATSDRLMTVARLGPTRLEGAYAWRRFLDLGLRIPGGSDFPVEPVNPFLGWYAAVSRQGLDGEPPGGWLPDQVMTGAEALRAISLDAAYGAFLEASLGSLEPGKWADFILVDADPFEVPARRIADITVLGTWVAGRQEFPSTP
ncbi:MAG: amidohydrolase [Gammaproteobacteria bacterium]|nr:amidohydrolase [Gammaproteobacteria bacterium]